jgi:beta-glucosidase
MFDRDFLWGAASAAHQIEGAYLDDGKGLGLWDCYERQKKHIKHGENAHIACDHYHRFKEDIGLMQQLHLKCYRFSVSWPRVMPNGTGEANEAGLAFYSDLVDALLEAGIKPMVTLYHWNLPYELHKKGGWKNPESPRWFEEYAKAVVGRLSDRVEHWITFNEPQLFVGGGYHAGFHAPFEQNDIDAILGISKNVLLAHGRAVSAIRRSSKKPCYIGMAPIGPVHLPKSDSPEDIDCARKKSFAVNAQAFAYGIAWWSDPVYLGQFSKETYEAFGNKMIALAPDEWAEISQPLDFYGFNVYQADNAYPIPEDAYDDNAYQGSPRTAMDWNVTPDVMYWSARFLHERYKKPLMIAENGMAGMDWVSLDGKVHDPQRIDFVQRYLIQLERAMDEGVPVLGYQYWSIMDNFEWTEGFDRRFGLIHVDYRTQKRVLKDSALWYKQLIDSAGSILHA